MQKYFKKLRKITIHKFDISFYKNSLLKNVWKIDFGINFPKIWIASLSNSDSFNRKQNRILRKNFLINAVNKRKIEFIASRELASYALLDFSIIKFIVKKSKQGFPIWPKKISGSISHNKSKVVIMIAKDDWILGVDIEKIMSDERSYLIKRRILTYEELSIIKKYKKYPINIIISLIFSAKETLYKAFYNYFYGLNSFIFVSLNADKEIFFKLPNNNIVNVHYEITEDEVITWIFFKKSIFVDYLDQMELLQIKR